MYSTKPTHNFTIERLTNPAAFFAANASELAEVGADAFGQDPQDFAAQVAERFEKSSIAQVARDGQRRIAGFALHNVLPSRHWQPVVY